MTQPARETDAAMEALLAAIPAQLDATGTFAVEGKPVTLGFDDEHEFTLRVPAWALRMLKREHLTRSHADVT